MAFEYFVYDAETNGLKQDCTRMWILAAKDIVTAEVKFWLEGDTGWKEIFDNGILAIGHNVCGFDELVLRKLFNYKIPAKLKVRDTLVMSRVLNYRRFGEQGHSMEVWGEALGQPKVEHEDWSKFSPEMQNRCISDVHLNEQIYNHLMVEFEALAARSPNIGKYLIAEQYVSRWSGECELQGWPFNKEKARALLVPIEAEMQLAYDALTSRLGNKVVAVDKKKGEYFTRKPKWIKSGCYDTHTANWFGINPWNGYESEDRLVEGEYSRVEIRDLSLDSPQDVKLFLYRNGWEPTDWNIKRQEDGSMKKTSPKITLDSLEFLGNDGKLYVNFLSAKSRFAQLSGWLEALDADDKIHGECITIGTPSMRARHKTIVNVPTGDSSYGKEFRELFVCPPGWKIIGCDSAGNQARGLAHYLGDPDYIHTLLTGDIHMYNAGKIDAALKMMGVDWNEFLKRTDPDSTPESWPASKRAVAKRILYAFLFGASGGKLWSYIFKNNEAIKGNKFKQGFIEAVPGFQSLLDKLKKVYTQTKRSGDGYIPSIVGNRVYVDSPHKLLVYLLQSLEKITCSLACWKLMVNLEKANIEYVPLIFYHDELDFMVKTENAEEAAEIGRAAFREGPKEVGVTIMDGGSKIGDNWYETH